MNKPWKRKVPSHKETCSEFEDAFVFHLYSRYEREIIDSILRFSHNQSHDFMLRSASRPHRKKTIPNCCEDMK